MGYSKRLENVELLSLTVKDKKVKSAEHFRQKLQQQKSS
jgi:hypothetical protein